MVKDSNSLPGSRTFPPFPEQFFKGYARDFVELYGPIREAPPQFLGIAYMTLLGNAISPFVRFSGAQPRLYTVTVAPSGSKKSAGNDIAQDFFARALAGKQQIVGGFGSSEGLLKALEKAGRVPVVLALDEFATLAKKTNIQGSAGIDPLNKLFERNDYDHRLSKKSLSVTGAYLSILGATTPDTFQNVWSEQHEDAGFFSRLLVVGSDAPPRKHSVLDEPDGELLWVLMDETGKLVEALRKQTKEGAEPIELQFLPGAREAWGKFYQELADQEEYRRIDAIGWRLMTIQAVLKRERLISEETVREVIPFLEYEVAVRSLVKPIVADNSWAKMEEKIRRYLPKDGSWIANRDLQSKTNAARHGIRVYEWALRNLRTNEELEEERGPRGGRMLRRKPVAAEPPIEVEAEEALESGRMVEAAVQSFA